MGLLEMLEWRFLGMPLWYCLLMTAVLFAVKWLCGG